MVDVNAAVGQHWLGAFQHRSMPLGNPHATQSWLCEMWDKCQGRSPSKNPRPQVIALREALHRNRPTRSFMQALGFWQVSMGERGVWLRLEAVDNYLTVVTLTRKPRVDVRFVHRRDVEFTVRIPK